MIVGVDARPLAAGIYGGITEYTRQLLPALLAVDPTLELRLYFNAATQKLRQEPWMDDRRVKIYTGRLPNRFVFNPATRFLGWPKLNRKLGQVDLFFSPQPDLVGLDQGIPQVITVHDLAYCKFPELFERYRRQALVRQKLAYQFQRARHLIAVSQATQQDLIDFFKIAPTKISVIPLGLPDSLQERSEVAGDQTTRISKGPSLSKSQPSRLFARPYLLFLGVLEARKNVKVLVEAFNLLKQEQSSGSAEKMAGRLSLILAGPAGYQVHEVVEAVRRSPYKKDIHFTGPVDEQQKWRLYQNALAFVFPSLDEGFGLPPLEAAAQGVPVVASWAGALPEVLGESALYIDPRKPQELARALGQLLQDQELRQALSRQGKKRAAVFSWQKTAALTYQVFKRQIIP